MTLRDQLLAATDHHVRGSLRAAAAFSALSGALASAGGSELPLTSQGRSAVVYGVAHLGSTLTVYLDAAHSDENALVIVNPPTLVADPAGAVDVNGRSHREDVLQAITDVIAEHGGYATNVRSFPSRKSGNPAVRAAAGA